MKIVLETIYIKRNTEITVRIDPKVIKLFQPANPSA